MPVVKDLVPDLTTFYAQYASVKPWLQTRSAPPPPDSERLQIEGRAGEDRPPGRLHPVRVLLDGVPELLVEQRALPRPAALLASYRWIIDSRDESTGERLDDARRSVPPVSLPHHHELHRRLPEGSQPGEGDRRDQEDDGGAPALRRAGMDVETRKLLWRCRRGMKELDVVLERYARAHLERERRRTRRCLRAFWTCPTPTWPSISSAMPRPTNPTSRDSRALIATPSPLRSDPATRARICWGLFACRDAFAAVALAPSFAPGSLCGTVALAAARLAAGRLGGRCLFCSVGARALPYARFVWTPDGAWRLQPARRLAASRPSHRRLRPRLARGCCWPPDGLADRGRWSRLAPPSYALIDVAEAGRPAFPVAHGASRVLGSRDRSASGAGGPLTTDRLVTPFHASRAQSGPRKVSPMNFSEGFSVYSAPLLGSAAF